MGDMVFPGGAVAVVGAVSKCDTLSWFDLTRFCTTARVSKEDRWFGNAFQIIEATDENDLEAAMVVLRGGTHIEKDEEERSVRAGAYLGMRDER